MEKKNTILLTVIAIATLLVAVVGATFAYFTAQVTSDKADKNNQTNVTTAAFASANMAMGDKVTATDIAPGAKIVKKVTVTGTCPNGSDGQPLTSCTPAKGEISITETGVDAFDGDITWAIYESTDAITCDNKMEADSLDATTNKYYMTTKCSKGAELIFNNYKNEDAVDKFATDLGTAIMTNETTNLKKDIDVAGGSSRDFYLVVSYANNENAAQAQQGLNFTIDIDFGPSSTINVPTGS